MIYHRMIETTMSQESKIISGSTGLSAEPPGLQSTYYCE